MAGQCDSRKQSEDQRNSPHSNSLFGEAPAYAELPVRESRVQMRVNGGAARARLRLHAEPGASCIHAIPSFAKSAKDGAPNLWLKETVRLVCANQLVSLCAHSVMALNIVVEDLLELGDNGVATQSGIELAIYVDGGFGLLEGAGQADAEVGML